ncbi:MAG: peptidoglycan bridge formation glycyltransferase FemA/FemB family protein [Patescibacteria group bacterium]|nr:peptidoglycan bridge formation glycyltransferase FemA/FemB family protein [Patescibacteria group bacterium]
MIKEVLKKEDWTLKKEFLQSWEYGEFLKDTGRQLLRYELITDNEKIQFQGVVTSNALGLKFIYVPRVSFSEEILDEISKFFKEKNFVFWRIERLNSTTTKNFSYTEVRNRQPECTWLLDLEKSENEILSEMHSKTRYNINLAIKKGVVCKQEKNLETYWKLNEMTTERNSIRTHDKTYIEKLLKLDTVYQLTTYFGEDVLSSAIVFKYENKMYYLFGASSNSHRNLMGPYLNQFEIIKLAKQLGCKVYDFWGMAPPAKEGSTDKNSHHNYTWQKSHPLDGVAKFKAGFNGKLECYPKPLEIILNPFKYKIFSLIQKLRKRTIVGHSTKEK